MYILTLANLTSTLYEFKTKITPYDGFIENFFTDLLNNGFRWIELFELSRFSEISGNRFELDTAKESANRIVLESDLTSQTVSMIRSSVQINNYCRYHKLIRIFNKYYRFPDISVGNKHVATHIFRYHKAKLLDKAGWTVEDIAAYFGEIDLGNMQSYINADLYTELL